MTIDCRTRLNSLRLALLCAGLLSLSTAAAAGHATVTGVGMPSGSYFEVYSSAAGINDEGQVAVTVSFSSSSFPFPESHAYLYSGGVLRDLNPTEPQSLSYTTGINNSGQMSVNMGSHAFVYSNGTKKDLGALAGGISSTHGINDSGQVVGESDVGNGARHAFLYSNGAMTDLGVVGGKYSAAYAVNNKGQVAGASTTANNQGTHAFLYSAGAMKDLGTLGGSYSTANGINDSGHVVGYSYFKPNSGNYHAFLYADGAMKDLGALPGAGVSSIAYGINNSGQVVGMAYAASNPRSYAVLWNAGAAYDLNALAPSGWTLDRANAINSFAQIAGDGSHNGNTEAYVLTLHPDWQGGSGSWSDAGHWNFAGMGSFGITPGAPHDVVINPGTSATISGPMDAKVNSLVIGGSVGNPVTLDLNGGSIAATNGTTLSTGGILRGNGRLAGDLSIQFGGQASVGSGQAMRLAGNVKNGGRIDAQADDTRTSLTIDGVLTNAAGSRISLSNADVRAGGGTANAGGMVMSGFSSVYGRVDNQVGGQVSIVDDRSDVIFESFRNDGTVTVDTNAKVSFGGLVTGAGDFLGGGAKYFAGGYSPGNGPAQVTMDGPVTFDGGTITMELGGATPGSGYDQIVFLGDVTLSNGVVVLDVEYWNGWKAHLGDTYRLFDWRGSLSGTFSFAQLPTLDAGLAWDLNRLYTTGEIAVVAVPEPETYAMFLAGLGLLGFAARRKNIGSRG